MSSPSPLSDNHDIHSILSSSMEEDQQRVFKIVLTGGPCSGKTSSLSLLSGFLKFSPRDIKGIVLNPDLSKSKRSLQNAGLACFYGHRMLVNGGVSWADLSPEQAYLWLFRLQRSVMKLMIHLEDSYMDVAKLNNDGRNSLVICDRGLIDCAAYVAPNVYERLIKDLGFDNIHQVHARYDLVVHLLSAADGALEHYTLENNAARTEPPEMAREVDLKLKNVWTGHPYFVCIDNRTKFREKVLRVIGAICKRVAVPAIGMSSVKRKFLVESISFNSSVDGSPLTHYVDTFCTYTFLVDGNDLQHRVRKRIAGGNATFTHISRLRGTSGKFERYNERHRTIGEKEYDFLRSFALPNHDSISIIKRSFVFHNQYFQLSIFQNLAQHPNLMILELYEEEHHSIELPEPFVHVVKEITGDRNFSMVALSLRS